MRDDHIDLCGQVDFTRTEAMPLLEREAQFCFACAGCAQTTAILVRVKFTCRIGR